MPYDRRHSESHHGRSHRHTRWPNSGEPETPSSRSSLTRGEESMTAGNGSSRSRSARHHTSSSGGHSGNRFAFLCVFAGSLGFTLLLIVSAVSYSSQAPTHLGFCWFAGTCAVVALAAGVRAQLSQLHHWSRRVKRKLLIGMPAALCTLLVAIITARDQLEPPGGSTPRAPHQDARVDATPEDNNLIKPGWYGETFAGGVGLTVASFEENAAESRRINRIFLKPLTYATLTVINAGSSQAITLTSPQVTLLLDDGEWVPSLAAADLLAYGAGQDEILRKRLSLMQQVPVGGMIPDIPICLDAPFNWNRVKAVKVALDGGSVVVPGRMMTVAEKQAFVFRTPATRQVSATNVTAEAWFKDL